MLVSKKAFVIVPENSAPSQKIPAPSLFPFLEKCKQERIQSVIDVGAGRFRNLSPLLLQFRTVWIVDTKLQLQRMNGRIDGLDLRYPSFAGAFDVTTFLSMNLCAGAAVNICVLHIIPQKMQRLQLLRAMNRNLKPNGLLLVDVPFNETYYKGHLKKSNRHADGYLLGSGRIKTFYKEYSFDELKTLVEGTGFSFRENLGIGRHHSLIFAKNDNKLK